jgi:aquaporin Z
MNLDLIKFLVEIIGTFFFVSIVVGTLYDHSLGPIAVVVALLASIYFGLKTSGSHFNPVVSMAMFFKNKLSFNLLIGYIISQAIGAGLAVKFNNMIMSSLAAV